MQEVRAQSVVVVAVAQGRPQSERITIPNRCSWSVSWVQVEHECMENRTSYNMWLLDHISHVEQLSIHADGWFHSQQLHSRVIVLYACTLRRFKCFQRSYCGAKPEAASEDITTERKALQMLRICSAPSLLYQDAVYQAVVSSACLRALTCPYLKLTELIHRSGCPVCSTLNFRS